MNLMTRRILLFVLTLTFVPPCVHGQDLPSYIKENAIPINDPDHLSDSVYKLLSGFQLIMIGEMHGMNEPAQFVTSLAKLYANKGDSVMVGLEIPSGEMAAFLGSHSDSSIRSSRFFTKEALYGIESTAWAEMIAALNKVKNVKLFFYDQNQEDDKISKNRDSLMYLNIKSKILKNPGWKTITLSGNIHNMIQPFRGNNTMAVYLKKDKDLNISAKMCSLKHRYRKGTMMNNMGNGLELRRADTPDSDYSTAVDYNCYLLLLPENLTDNYNGIYFTRNVNAATMIKAK